MQEILNMLKKEDLVDPLVNALSHEHRTNQATIIRNLQSIIIKYGDMNIERQDGRNQSAIEFANKVKLLDSYIPYI